MMVESSQQHQGLHFLLATTKTLLWVLSLRRFPRMKRAPDHSLGPTSRSVLILKPLFLPRHFPRRRIQSLSAVMVAAHSLLPLPREGRKWARTADKPTFLFRSESTENVKGGAHETQWRGRFVRRAATGEHLWQNLQASERTCERWRVKRVRIYGQLTPPELPGSS